MTVYLDELMALNFLIDYLLLSSGAALAAAYCTRLRRMAAALVGALWAALAFLFPRAAGGAVSGVLCALFMTAVAFGFGGARLFFRRFLMLVLCAAVFGGFIMLASAAGRSGLRISGSGVYADIPGVVVLSVCVCAYILLEALLRFSAVTREDKPGLVSVRIVHAGAQACFYALSDTGNRLRDPLSGAMVMVCQAQAVEALFPPPARAALKCAESGEQTLRELARAGCARGFRLIPYSCVGARHGLLPVFRPDEVWINGRRRRDVVIGVQAEEIEKDAPWRAVMGTDREA